VKHLQTDLLWCHQTNCTYMWDIYV